MLQGVQPTTIDPNDYSAHLSLGGTGVLLPEYNVDAGMTMRNQNNDGYSFSCTGQTQTDNLIDQYREILDPIWTYKNTCYIEGHEMNQGCQIRNSFKATRVYGVKKEREDDVDALTRRGGSYFNIYDDSTHDWFDGIRTQIQLNKRAVSAGTPWFNSWSSVNSTGIMPMPTGDELARAKSNVNAVLWHNYAIKGWILIGGIPYLICKSWQGPTYGDKGWCYMSREVANAVFEIRGSAAFIQAVAIPDDIQKIKLDIMEVLLVYLNRLLGRLRYN